MSATDEPIPDWETVLSAAARLQRILPDAVLVGGTAAAIHAEHRRSHDADHVLTDLGSRFEEVLGQLESVAGWRTARVRRPVLILGNLDGIETGVGQLIRDEPLETATLDVRGVPLTVPTEAEILRIKGVLILRRNATRDYLDFAALADRLGDDASGEALQPFDRLYRQDNGQSPLQQLQAQLANSVPYDLDESTLAEYRHLDPKWHDWNAVKSTCARVADATFEYVCTYAAGHRQDRV
ncbi:MAG: hypothetical protein OXP36_06115 [Gammaproteobacteria bacterium]|nr:hypothetical protein [Gammaproteobacteria bacterium]